MKTALQVYTVRDAVNAVGGLEKALEKIAGIGYEGVEFAGYYDLPAKQLKKALDDNGLKAAGSHGWFDDLTDDFDNTVQYCLDIGLEYASVPGIPPEFHDSFEKTVETAQTLGKLAEKCEQRGLKLSFHNHKHEFTTVYNGKSVNEILLEYGAPLGFELDTGWSSVAGIENREYMHRLGNRLHLVHLKDVVGDHTPVEIGTGEVDIKKVVDTAKEMGVAWGIVEQDNMQTYTDPFESVAVSLANLKKLL